LSKLFSLGRKQFASPDRSEAPGPAEMEARLPYGTPTAVQQPEWPGMALCNLRDEKTYVNSNNTGQKITELVFIS
jgi:hypothetical protein